ncbi:MAG: glutamate-1-semialdehyde 2,1-aminomutase [Desulfococcaceae bacterium]
MKLENSCKLFEEALRVIPGGVNSPVRACKSVGGEPLFIEKADGCRITDSDGNRYIDYVGSWGPMILGHRHPEVIKLLEFVLTQGTSFGAPTVLEVRLAEMIVEAVPSMEMVRMVNSGTEATMSAIRLARAFTGRDGVLKFDGCYHGHADSLLVAAGSGVATLNIPGSPGVPRDFVKHTLSLPYNDVEAFKKVMDERGDELACVIVEPVAGNMGCVPPAEGFLEALRTETEKHGALLVFDEVMTGFRVAYGGAQALFGVAPDLTCLAKIIGGGLPVGAYGGRKEIMNQVAPQGPMYQAGTLSGNPLAMAAGVATLKELQKPGVYETLEERANRLAIGLQGAATVAGVPTSFNRVGSMLGMFFTEADVTDFESAKTSDLDLFGAWYRAMLQRGIYLAPSQFEASFVSLAHAEGDIDETVRAAAETFTECADMC